MDNYLISEIITVVINGYDANCRSLKIIKILNQQAKWPRSFFPKNQETYSENLKAESKNLRIQSLETVSIELEI